MLDLYNQVEKYVIASFTNDGKLSARGQHLLKTKQWLMKIYPEADEAMQIAAVSHDIDSAFVEYNFQGKFNDPEYLRIHQDESARIIGDFLLSHGTDSEIIERIKGLIIAHEVGGDSDQDMIMDADSLGFFDGDLSEFIKKMIEKGNELQNIREKIVWMFDRIASPNAKELARPLYLKALSLLKNLG